jgi:homogentisate 1,2-dioxygenase
MTLFKADGLRVDLSKRTKEAMNFWHRSCDFHELIFCFQGSILWETELGNVELKPGQMLLIPKGIAHRSSPGQTERPNIIMELKIDSRAIEEIVSGQDVAQKGEEGKGGK